MSYYARWIPTRVALTCFTHVHFLFNASRKHVHLKFCFDQIEIITNTSKALQTVVFVSIFYLQKNKRSLPAILVRNTAYRKIKYFYQRFWVGNEAIPFLGNKKPKPTSISIEQYAIANMEIFNELLNSSRSFTMLNRHSKNT